jgi:hypothetical protein
MRVDLLSYNPANYFVAINYTVLIHRKYMS